MEKKKTEPNRTEINWFEPVFGSVRFKKLKKKIRFGCLFWFKTGPNRKCSALCHLDAAAKLILWFEQNELGGDDFDELDDVIEDLNYVPAI